MNAGGPDAAADAEWLLLGFGNGRVYLVSEFPDWFVFALGREGTIGEPSEKG